MAILLTWVVLLRLVLEHVFESEMEDALDGLDAALQRLTTLDLSRLDAPALALAFQRLEAHSRRRDSVEHGVVREIDLRGVALEAGCRNTASYLRGLSNIAPSDAKRRVDAARRPGAGPDVDRRGPGTDLPDRRGRARRRVVVGRARPGHHRLYRQTPRRGRRRLRPDHRTGPGRTRQGPRPASARRRRPPHRLPPRPGRRPGRRGLPRPAPGPDHRPTGRRLRPRRR